MYKKQKLLAGLATAGTMAAVALPIGAGALSVQPLSGSNNQASNSALRVLSAGNGSLQGNSTQTQSTQQTSAAGGAGAATGVQATNGDRSLTTHGAVDGGFAADQSSQRQSDQNGTSSTQSASLGGGLQGGLAAGLDGGSSDTTSGLLDL